MYLIDRCCFCWCSLIFGDGHYDDSDDDENDPDEYDENSRNGDNYKKGTIIITLADPSSAFNDSNNNFSTWTGDKIRIDFDFESESDSVQDDTYYENYAINKYSAIIPNDDKRILHACTMLSTARKTVNTKKNNLTMNDMNMICMCYEQSIGTLGNKQQPAFKRRIIKEYEYVKSGVSPNILKDVKIELNVFVTEARKTENSVEDRKYAYRNAIKLTIDITSKKNLKLEYNEFLLSLATEDQ